MVKILGLSAAVSVFLLLHGGLQVVKSTLNVLGTILSFVLFFVSHTGSTIEAGLIALEDGLIAAAIHVLAKKGPVA